MKLREFPWWPRSWRTTNYEDVAPERVSQDGVFETCRLSPQGLIIEIEYNGKAVVGRIGRSVNAPNLERVRDFLLDYSGDSMATIEDLDVAPDLNTR